jgi:hypothetical protein
VLLLVSLPTLAAAAWVTVLPRWARQAEQSEDITLAKRIFEQSITTPSTVKYISAELVFRRHEKRIVHLVADAQNPFGAMLRDGYCVSFQRHGHEATWNRLAAVTPCGIEPPGPKLLAIARAVNGWKDEEGDSDDTATLKRTDRGDDSPRLGRDVNDELTGAPALVIHGVRLGMTIDQVKAVLGAPTRKTKDEIQQTFHYRGIDIDFDVATASPRRNGWIACRGFGSPTPTFARRRTSA